MRTKMSCEVVEDGEVAESLQPSERATLHMLQPGSHEKCHLDVLGSVVSLVTSCRHGLRDYIDFALDEVGTTPHTAQCEVRAVSDCQQRELPSVSHGFACRSRMLNLSRSSTLAVLRLDVNIGPRGDVFLPTGSNP